MALSGDDEHKIFLLLGRIEANQSNTLLAIKELKDISHVAPCTEFVTFKTKVYTKIHTYGRIVAGAGITVAVITGGIKIYDRFFAGH